jgi:hypothetical protein
MRAKPAPVALEKLTTLDANLVGVGYYLRFLDPPEMGI